MDLSPGGLFVSIIVSGIGFVLFVYGRKQARLPHAASGFVLMVYPYFVAGALWMLGIAAAILGGLWYGVRYLGW